MIKNKIRVLIVEDSGLYQMYLRRVIESDECLSVAGTADCGVQALDLIAQLQPDVITLDLQLPDIDGLELLEKILQQWDIPVIVVSGNADACEQAIRLGARDFIEKMQDANPKTAEQFRLLLKLKLKMQAERHPADAQAGDSAVRFARTSGGAKRTTAVERPSGAAPSGSKQLSEAQNPEEHIIAIGASLGGTETTLQILERLSTDMPGMVIVQHMPPEYTAAYAVRLDRYCSIKVREARSGDRVLPGTALVARGGEQLTVCRAGSGFRVKVGGTQRYGGFCPSVDVMFQSVAKSAGSAALGIILTGMGKDGADGLRQMHDQGAYTLGQDEESCAVFGMPGVAWKLGGVDKLLSPDAIADEVKRYYSGHKRSEDEAR